jgi:hypothetical protein
MNATALLLALGAHGTARALARSVAPNDPMYQLTQQPDAIPAANATPITPPSTDPHEGRNDTEKR